MSQTNSSTKKQKAVGYIRQSVTKNENDMTSPERQEANIRKIAEKYDLELELYSDAKGHKSGTKEENREGWLALKERLSDQDVTTVIVNDQSRAMRSLWRTVKFLEELPEHGVTMRLAYSDTKIDMTTSDGRLSATFQAFLDEQYAIEASKRAKDSVRYRKEKGRSIGIPPFGTIRDKKGHLVRRQDGAWMLANGNFEHGLSADEPPESDAIWRGYADAAQRVLTLYAANEHGYSYIADQMNSEGWAFRNRHGMPRRFGIDDVLRVVSNWREYAGIVPSTTESNDNSTSSDSNRHHARRVYGYHIDDPLTELKSAQNHVFPIELLQNVALTQKARSRQTKPNGKQKKAYPFALSNILYCADCYEIAMKKNKPEEKVRIIGWSKKGELYYRHAVNGKCNCGTKSLKAELVEADVLRLLKLLDVTPDQLDNLIEFAIAIQEGSLGRGQNQEIEFEVNKRQKIAQHQKAIRNMELKADEGLIDYDNKFKERRSFHEREIERWQHMTTDSQKLRMSLSECSKQMELLTESWASAIGEAKQKLAHSLFDEIVYNLNTRQIVGFRLKVWAELFLMRRGEMFWEELTEDQKNHQVGSSSSLVSYYSPNGLLSLS